MVITKEMPVSGIVHCWDQTKEIFLKCCIPVDSNRALKEHLKEEKLDLIIYELNKLIGSSEATCIEGG